MNNLFYIILKKDFKDNLLSNKAWFTISFFLLCLIIFPLTFGSSQYLELNNIESSFRYRIPFVALAFKLNVRLILDLLFP